MRDDSTGRRTVLAALGTASSAALAGCSGVLDWGGSDDSDGGAGNGVGAPEQVDRLWTAGTTTEYAGNHHEMGAIRVDGKVVVAVPRSEDPDTEGCGLLALDAGGETRWRRDLPAEVCDPHAVGDVAVGELDGDPILLVATIEKDVVAYAAATGGVRFEAELVETVPYGHPVISPPLADGSRRVVVVDNLGHAVVANLDGSTAWRREFEGVVYPAPVVRDVDGDGAVEVVVATDAEQGWLVAHDAAGEERWRTAFETGGRALSSVERDDHRDLVLSTWGGQVAAVDGRSGETRWSELLAERGILGGSDGERLYAGAGDGVVHAIDPNDGTVVWTVDSIGSSAPANAPVVGHPREGAPVVASLAYDGALGLIDAETGSVLVEHSFGEETYTSPLFADLTGDGSDDLLVMFGDARVEAYRLSL